MRDGHLVIDLDAHYLEPVDELSDYLDEPLRSQVKRSNADAFIPGAGVGDVLMGGRIQRQEFGSQYRDPNAKMDLENVKSRLGIDAFALISNNVLTLAHSSQRHVVNGYYNAYTDYMLAKVADPATGAYIMIPVSWQDPEAGAALINRIGDHPAVVAVNLVAATQPLGDERYNVIYQAAQDHSLPIVYHSTRGLGLSPNVLFGGEFQKYIELHTVGPAVSNIIQLTSLLVHAVPERFPNLKFVFEESGLFWVPMVVHRLDQEFLKRRSEAPLLRKLPSEYVRDCCYFGIQPMESPKEPVHLQAVIEMIGVDRLLYTSDYPHWDYDDPIVITQLEFLTESDKAAILGGNAQQVFDFRRGGEQLWESAGRQASAISARAAGSSSP